MNQIKISIIIPVYNCENFIIKCLRSIQEQSFTEFEVIIIDDGSTDSTISKIENFIRKDIRFKLYKNQHNGPSTTRNFGINYSKGELISFIDADDYISSDYLEVLYEKMKNYDTDLACVGYVEQGKNGINYINDYSRQEQKFTSSEFLIKIFNGTGGTLWGKLFRTDIIRKNAIFLDNDIYMCEDLVFLLRYLLLVKNVVVIDKYLYFYNRLNETSITSKISLAYIENLLEVIKRIDLILEENQINVKLKNEIIKSRIQNLILMFISQIHDKSYDSLYRKKMMQILLENSFIDKYSESFYSNKISIKILFFLIRKRWFKLLNMYSYWINIINSSKYFIKKRLLKRKC